MAIFHDPGGTLVNGTLAMDTMSTFMADINTRLTAAGWTASNYGSRCIGTFTGVPANNQTVTVAGQVYTFKTTLTGAANEVLIGGSASACASNLFDAITDNSANEGTTYGTGTSANATCSATVAAGVITVFRNTGNPWDTFTVAEGLNNFTWDVTTSRDGGYRFLSAKTPEGLQYITRFSANTTTRAIFHTESTDLSVSRGCGYLAMVASRLLRIYAHRYGYFICLLGAVATDETEICTGLLKLRAGAVGSRVNSVADNGSGLIRVTLNTAQPTWQTGATVFFDNATNTGAYWSQINGLKTVTRIDDSTFDIQGSTYSSGYDANSAWGARSPGQISRCFFGLGDDSSGKTTFRGSMSLGFIFVSLCVTENTWGGSINTANTVFLKFPTYSRSLAAARIRNFGGSYDWVLPRMCWRLTDSSSTPYDYGDLYAAAILCNDVTLDTTKTNLDGADWIVFSNDTLVSLMIATNRV